MTTAPSIDHALPPVLQRDEACLREGVARRHGRWRNAARTMPRSSLRPTTNQPRHNAQRWVEKVGRSIKGSDTPQDRGRRKSTSKRLTHRSRRPWTKLPPARDQHSRCGQAPDRALRSPRQITRLSRPPAAARTNSYAMAAVRRAPAPPSEPQVPSDVDLTDAYEETQRRPKALGRQLLSDLRAIDLGLVTGALEMDDQRRSALRFR